MLRARRIQSKIEVGKNDKEDGIVTNKASLHYEIE